MARSVDLLRRAIRNDFPFGMDFAKRGLRGAQRSSGIQDETKSQNKLPLEITFRSNSASTKNAGVRRWEDVCFSFCIYILFVCFVFEKYVCDKTFLLIGAERTRLVSIKNFGTIFATSIFDFGRGPPGGDGFKP